MLRISNDASEFQIYLYRKWMFTEWEECIESIWILISKDEKAESSSEDSGLLLSEHQDVVSSNDNPKENWMTRTKQSHTWAAKSWNPEIFSSNAENSA